MSGSRRRGMRVTIAGVVVLLLGGYFVVGFTVGTSFNSPIAGTTLQSGLVIAGVVLLIVGAALLVLGIVRLFRQR